MQRLTCEILVVLLYDPNVSAVFPAARCRAVATALMGGGGGVEYSYFHVMPD